MFSSFENIKKSVYFLRICQVLKKYIRKVPTLFCFCIAFYLSYTLQNWMAITYTLLFYVTVISYTEIWLVRALISMWRWHSIYFCIVLSIQTYMYIQACMSATSICKRYRLWLFKSFYVKWYLICIYSC